MNEERHWDRCVASAYQGMQWALSNGDAKLFDAYNTYIQQLIALRELAAQDERLQYRR
jgi:predicted kinase